VKWLISIVIVLISVSVVHASLYYENQEYTLQSLSALGLNDKIKIDANGDGDIKDEEDYLRYTHILITDTSKGIKFKPAYVIEVEDAPIQKIENFDGEFITINGISHFVAETSYDEITITPDYVKKRIHVQDYFSASTSYEVLPDIKFGLDSRWNLNIILNDSIAGFIKTSDYTKKEEITHAINEITHALEGYRVFIYNKGSNWIEVVLAPKEKLTILEDSQKDVYGYALVRINSDEIPKGSGRIIFFGKEYNISFTKDLEVKIKFDDPTYYYFKMDYIAKRLSASLGYIPTNTSQETGKKGWRGLEIKGESNKLYSLSKVELYPPEIRVDGNKDGDVYDPEDYPIYNKFYVLDAPSAANVRLVYAIEAPMINEYFRSSIDNLVGSVVKIFGLTYIITKTDDDLVTLGKQPILKTLTKKEAMTPEAALNFVDNIKLGFSDDPSSDSSNDLFIYQDDKIIGIIPIKKDEKDITYEISQIARDLEGFVFLIANFSSKEVTLALIREEDLIKITDESKDVLGYDKVFVNSKVFPDGKGCINFLSKLYTLKYGENETIEDYPFYTLQYNTFGEIRIVRGDLPKSEIIEKTVNETKDMVIEENITYDSTEAVLEEITIQKPVLIEENIDADSQESFFEIINSSMEEINSYTEKMGVPGILKHLASGRVNINVENETIGLVIEDGRIKEIKEGGLPNPTSEIWTSKDFVENLSNSEDPVGEIISAKKSGVLKKKDKGIFPKLKGFIVDVLLRIASLLS